MSKQLFERNGKAAGFTLVEIVIVVAISSALLVIVLAGQRGLRSRAQFDAAVNKMVSTVGDANTQASAGVNIIGSGDGTNRCSGGPAGQYVFAGMVWTADNSLPGSPIKHDYYKVGPVKADGPEPGVVACIFDTRPVSLPAPVTVNAPGGRVLMLRNNNGSLDVCQANNPTANPAPSFQAGACVAPFARGTLTLNLSDTDGHVSQVLIEQSGLARRQN